MPRTLWVIDPSVATPEDQGVAEVLQGWTGESRVLRPNLSGPDGPDASTGYETDGVVLLGSAASVYDEAPWIAALGRWLEPIIAGRVRLPLLGVCYGHQHIAHVAGAQVGFLRPDRSKSVGVETTQVQDSRLLQGDAELRVVVSHREQVAEVPSGFRCVARREGSALDGLEHESLPIFTFQFHPEAREEFAVRAGFDPLRIDARLREDGQRLLGAFRRIVDPGH